MKIGLIHGGIVAASLALTTACPAADDAADGGGSEGETESGDSSTGGGMGTNGVSDTGGSTGGMGGSGTDTGNDTDGTGGETDAGDTTAATDAGDTGDSSGDSTGGGGVSYPPCPGGAKECPDDYDVCLPADFGGGGGGGMVPYNWCSMGCMGADDCPAPSSGDATAVCRGGNGGDMGFCLLSCSDGETCPDGMGCEMTPGPMGGMICAWPNE